MMLTPSQLRAKEDILRAIHAQAPLIELRSPSKTRTRGHGVTTVLAAVAEELGVKKVLGVGDALCEDGRPDAASQIYSAALEQLASCGIAIIDDLDLAVAPRTVKRSRTLVESLQGSASVYQWGADATAPRVLKALVDAAVVAAVGCPPRCVLFSSAEDGHEPFLQPPLVVSLGAPSAEDYASLLRTATGGAHVDADAVYQLHGELSAADLRSALVRAANATSAAAGGGAAGGVAGGAAGGTAGGGTASAAAPTTESVLRAVRAELMATSAVEPSEVEAVDLGNYPGMGEIHERLEKEV